MFFGSIFRDETKNIVLRNDKEFFSGKNEEVALKNDKIIFF